MLRRTVPLSIALILASACIAIVVRSQAQAAVVQATQPIAARTYVGSTTCRGCHQAVYDRWSKTLMANVVTDPKEHPERVLPDFTKADPLLTFKLDDVALVYGNKWKQRYFKKVG